MAQLLRKELPMGEYMPDRPEYMNPGAPSAANILWVDGAYVPALSFASLGQSIGAVCQGAYAGADANENLHIYLGNASALEEYTPTGFVNRSVAGGYHLGQEQYWKFVQWTSQVNDNLLFATSYSDPVQQIDPRTGTAFAATVASVGTIPKASQIANIGQFIMLGDTEDVVNGAVPNRVQWCGIGDTTNWDYNTLNAQATQAGQQFMNANYGRVTHISNGGIYGLIFQERAITRAYYVGGDVVFDFTGTVDLERGCAFPNSAVQIGGMVWFLAHDGFCMTDGQSVKQIGHGKVDTTFLANLSQQFPEQVRGCYDPSRKLIFWGYCSSGNNTGIPDQVLAYNYMEDRFCPVTQSLSAIFNTMSYGYTMDTLNNVSLNLDSITPTLDSPYWEGGNPQVGAVDGSGNYGTLTGPALTASIDTPEWDSGGDMTFIDGMRPIFSDSVGAGVVTVTPKTRNTENTSYSVGSAASPNARTGICNFRKTARYVRGSISIAGGFDKLSAVDVYAKKGGRA